MHDKPERDRLEPPEGVPSLEQIRAALQASTEGPLKSKDLARVLGLAPGHYRGFKAHLRALEVRGELYRNRGQRYAVPAEIHLVVGTLQVTRGGDGFVRPDDPRESEVFVQGRHLESAMDGDRIAVRIEGRPKGRAPIGRVVKVLERGRPTVVGRFQANRTLGFVSPLDRRVGRDVLVPTGAAGDAKSGDIVVVRIVQFGDAHRNSIGEIETILGPMEAPGVDVLAILHGHGLPRAFPEEVEEAAAEAADRARVPGPREDLRDRLVFTIDPSDARDHDDALSLREVRDGVWEVGVHIADVSHFVQEGSALDLEALRRGTSVYLVDQVVPMLPHLLSSDLCSLREGEDRLALSVFVELNEEGQILSHRFAQTLVRCGRGLHYEQVQDVLMGTGSIDPTYDAVLQTLDRLAKGLRKVRKDRGSLDFDLPEARVVLGPDGVPEDIRRVVQLDSHRLIEDFMLLANELVATAALARKLPVPFRVHEPPPADRLEGLREFLDSVGHGLGRRAFSPRVLQEILDKVKGRPEENLVSTVLLRSMNRARYDGENVGHFGLASKAYLHFTSPIRRYPDLVVHRVIRRGIVEGKPVPEAWFAALDEICVRSSERERKAQLAERDSIEMKKIEFMRRHLGEEFEGTISSVTAFGFFVLLDRVFVEGLVHISTIGNDYYTFLPGAYALAGERNGKRFRLGDRVRVQVVRADKEERQIDFLLRQGPDGELTPERPGEMGGSGRPGGGRGKGGPKSGGRSGSKSGRTSGPKSGGRSGGRSGPKSGGKSGPKSGKTSAPKPGAKSGGKGGKGGRGRRK